MFLLMIVRKTMAKRKPNPTSSMVLSKEHTLPEEQVLSESSGLPSSTTEMPEENQIIDKLLLLLKMRCPIEGQKTHPHPPVRKGWFL